MVTHQQAEHRVNAGFWIHMACYIVVVSALAVLNYQRNPDNLWVLWVPLVAGVLASLLMP